MSCLISSSGKQVSKRNLINCFNRNENVGILFLDENYKFQTRKPGTNFDNFYKFYSENVKTPSIIFFNDKETFGKDKVKPFILSPNLYVFIEGLIPNIEKFTNHKTKSEIQLFVEQVLRPIARIDENLFIKPSVSTLLSKFIGKSGKLVFFYQKQKPTFIYNMSLGNLEDDGHNWYSNSNYKCAGVKQTYFFTPKSQIKSDSNEEQYSLEQDNSIDLEIEDLTKIEKMEEQEELKLLGLLESERYEERRIRSFQELAREDIWPSDDRNYY